MRIFSLRLLGVVLAIAGLGLIGWEVRGSTGQDEAVLAARRPAVIRQVQVLAGKRWHTLTGKQLASSALLPANLLLQAGVRIFPGDLILANGVPVSAGDPLPPAPVHSLAVRPAAQITLVTPEHRHTFSSTAATLGEALAQEGFDLHQADRLEPGPETPLRQDLEPGQPGLEVFWQPARPVTVEHDGSRTSFYSAAASTGEALAEAGLPPQGLDYTQPALDAPLPEDGHIRLVRVAEQVIVESQPLPFETELQASDQVELDHQEVIQAGEYGMTARRIRIRMEDGVEAGRQVESEWVARQPKNQIVGYGTKIVIRTLDTPDGPIEYWRSVQMYATSYSPCRIYEDRCDSYTALGATLQRGVVAMTNDWCRYTCGDSVYVPGYGKGTVLDTGGGIPGRYWIDLGYSEEDYVSWHQWVTVYFLTPVPANYQVVLP